MNSKIIKDGILILLLVIPASVFIFLKTFGENTFSLPYYLPVVDEKGDVLFSKGDTVFYTVPNLEFSNTSDNKRNLYDSGSKINVLTFHSFICDSLNPDFIVNLGRLNETFKGDKVMSLFSVYSLDSSESIRNKSDLNLSYVNWLNVNLNSKVFSDLNNRIDPVLKNKSLLDNCVNYLEKNNVVLLDSHYKVRGLYNGFDINEIERLRLEIKVLNNIETNGK
jgi:protein SCO1